MPRLTYERLHTHAGDILEQKIGEIEIMSTEEIMKFDNDGMFGVGLLTPLQARKVREILHTKVANLQRYL